MSIKLTSVYVDGQGKAQHFYTEVLGFVKKATAARGSFAGLRWSHKRTRTARSCNWR
jgi:hypothetical protein